jgi:hypothetical protein
MHLAGGDGLVAVKRGAMNTSIALKILLYNKQNRKNISSRI